MKRPSSTIVEAFSLVFIWLFFLWMGRTGIDFGSHYDEWYLKQGLSNAIESLTLLTGEYTYNGVYFDLGMVLLTPDFLRHARAIVDDIKAQPLRPFPDKDLPSLRTMREDMKRTVQSDDFIIRVRSLSLLVSSLSLGLFFFCFTGLLPEASRILSFGLTFLFASNFQFVSHSRFIAVDAVMVTAFLTMLLGCLWWMRVLSQDKGIAVRDMWGPVIAGVGAGLGMACKLTGIFFLSALLVMEVVHWCKRKTFLPVAASLLASLLTFFVLSPGNLLDPIRAIAAIYYERAQYNTAFAQPGYPYYVDAPWGHLGYLTRWLGLDAFSHFSVVSLVLFCLGGIGLWVGFREERLRVFAGITLMYVLVFFGFMSTNRLMIIRNYLTIIPLGLLWAGVGLDRLSRVSWATAGQQQTRSPYRMTAVIAVSFVYVAGLLGAVDSIDAAQSVGRVGRHAILEMTLNYLAKQEARFWIGPRLHADISNMPSWHWPCRARFAEESPSPQDKLVFYWDEHDWRQWLANRPGFAEAVFSSREVDYVWYPTWLGKNTRYRTVSVRWVNGLKMRMSEKDFLVCEQ